MPPQAVARRPAAAPPPVVGVNFGEDALYSGGFLLPEGRYAMFFDARIHAYTKGDGTRGQEKLGIMVTAYSLEDGSKHEQFLSMGSKAHLSFAPDPETGKSIRPIPGATAATFAGSTNWDTFRRSLYDCGLPPGVFTNNLETIDGIWVVTKNVPEPEGRKNFGQSTGEVEQAKQGPQLVPIVTEILEDGRPWEGTGGLPENAQTEEAAAPAPAKPAAAKTAPKPVAKAAAPAAKAPTPAARKAAAPPPPAEESGEVDALEMAKEGIASVLEKTPAGSKRPQVRAGTFTYVKKTYGDAAAQAVVNEVMNVEEQFEAALNLLGYTLAGDLVNPV